MIMSSLFERIRTNATDPSWWNQTALPAIRDNPGEIVARAYWNIVSRENENILDRDWDHLVLLDGCRFDLFEEVNQIEGELTNIISVGSGTSEWLKNTFENRTCYDIVYVTANPMYRSIDFESPFHAIVDVWDNRWDHNLNTVSPLDMREATIEAEKKYPNKRILTHWLQPHYPFIADSANKIGNHAGIHDINPNVSNPQQEQVIWEKLRNGTVGQNSVWTAYRENLELALREVDILVDQLDGRIVITSDHGNMLGERAWPIPVRLYGHPLEIYTEELVKVPWFVIENRSRRNIEAESPEPISNDMKSDISDRLRDLGYLDN